MPAVETKLPKTTDEILREVRHQIESWNENGEAAIEGLAALYTDDLFFQDPLQQVHGKQAFIEMNRRLTRRAKTMRFDLHSAIAQAGEIFLAWTMLYEMKVGPRLVVEGTTHLRLRGEQVAYHRDYWDLASSVAHAVPGVGKVYERLIKLAG